MSVIDVETPQGPARVHLHHADHPKAALLMGHGAGGGVDTPDLAAASDAALACGISVALVEQPYRVAGKRSQPAAAKLDEAWIAVAAELGSGELEDLPLVAGGRSAGARVACRTADATGAVAVLCLAFPLHPPGKPERSRLAELEAVEVPTLVVQGDRDPFGMPPEGPGRTIATVAGNHGLKQGSAEAGDAVREWLPRVLRAPHRSA